MLAAHIGRGCGISPPEMEDTVANEPITPNTEAYEAGIEAEIQALFAAKFGPNTCGTPDRSYWREQVLANRAAVAAAKKEAASE